VDRFASDDSRIDALVIEFLDRREREGDAVLEEMCAAAPEAAPALRERIAGLRAAGLLDPADEAQRIPETLGDFALEQRLGGGGMGVVYVARQVSLGRRVALKLIRPEHLYFPGARERFGREVQAVARLAHPGIAPVHTVGQHDGVPFFAMELIEGKSLAEVLDCCRDRARDRLTGRDLAPDPGAAGEAVFGGTWVQACLRIARQVAEALEYAHRKGVVHRDVKPSNIMLTPEGRAMLVDFGLAHTRGADRLTRSGAAVGSAPYMPPEVATGLAAEGDARGDVYSLGVTLYEMLTLRLPFGGETRDDILRAVREARPPHPRSVWRAIPADAETVCLAAMDQDPARRFQSAEAFARDLTNVLELRPIEARPLPVSMRLFRWAQRNPSRAVAVALAMLVVIGGPIVFGVQQALARARVSAALDDRSAALALAEENFGAACEAVEYMLDRVGDEALVGVPHMETVRRDLLQRALAFYRRFLEQKTADPEVLRRMAHAYHLVGVLHVYLQEHDAAEDAFRGAVRAWRELGAHDASTEVRSGLGEELAQLAAELSDRRAFSEAEVVWEEARSVLEALGEDAGRAGRKAMAMLWRVHGGLRERQARPAEGGTSYERAIAAYRALLAEAPDPKLAQHLAFCEIRRASCARDDPDTAEALLRSAVAALEELTAEHPDDLGYQRELGAALQVLGALLSARSRDEAESVLLRALDVRERLATDYPRALFLQRHLFHALENLAVHYQRVQRDADAVQMFGRALEFQRGVLRRHPDAVEARDLLAEAAHNNGVMRYREKRWPEALALFDEAAAIRRTLVAADESDAATRRDLLESLSARLSVFEQLRDHRAAAAAVAEITQVGRSALSPQELQRAGTALARCAAWANADGEMEQRSATAREHADRAVELWLQALAAGAERAALAALPELDHVRGAAEWPRLAEQLGIEAPLRR
jgi:serine/threonine protein kinase